MTPTHLILGDARKMGDVSEEPGECFGMSHSSWEQGTQIQLEEV